MNLSNLDLDINKIGSWPTPIKIVVVLVLCLLIVGLAYYLDTQDQLSELQKESDQEHELKTVFETKQKKQSTLRSTGNNLMK